MRVLVTGVCGFVGRHLVGALRQAGHTVVGLDLRPGDDVLFAADIRDPAAIAAAVAASRPEACVHLAGLAFVPDGERDPSRLAAINVDGTRHVAEALLSRAPRARLLFVSTAQVYGPARAAAPLHEDAPLRPASAYAAAKAEAEALLHALHAREGLDLLVARPGNHIGPGQEPVFVVPAFAAAVRAVARGEAQTIPVGNLASVRDFTDVRDVAEAYTRLLTAGRPGLAYNISANVRLTMGELLAKLAALAGVAARPVVDPARFRPADATPELDTTRLQRETGWKPAHTIDRTLADVWAATDCGR